MTSLLSPGFLEWAVFLGVALFLAVGAYSQGNRNREAVPEGVTVESLEQTMGGGDTVQ